MGKIFISKMRQLLLISSSKVHGYEYLECASKELTELLNKNKVRKVLFIPYALSDHDAYLQIVKNAMSRWGYDVEGIHHQTNLVDAINKAEAIFVGGGNTFRLLKNLYEKNLIEHIQKRVLEDGIPYIGSSAGTNVATRSIHTTNDMPITYPPSFDALHLVHFNINVHYMDADAKSTHKGETREERIKQYLEEPEVKEAVVGLREGSSLLVEGNKITLKGLHKARLFVKGKEPEEIEIESCLDI